MLISKGNYVEVVHTGLYLDVGGDYLQGILVVRTVANGFDNTRTHEFPGMDGEFVQGKSGEEIHKLAQGIWLDMLRDLKRIYKFPVRDLGKLTIPLIQTKTEEVDSFSIL